MGSRCGGGDAASKGVSGRRARIERGSESKGGRLGREVSGVGQLQHGQSAGYSSAERGRNCGAVSQGGEGGLSGGFVCSGADSEDGWGRGAGAGDCGGTASAGWVSQSVGLP